MSSAPPRSQGAQAVRCLQCDQPYFTGRMVMATICAVCMLRAAGGLAGIGPKRRPERRQWKGNQE